LRGFTGSTAPPPCLQRSCLSQALEAEVSGEYDVALKLYKELLERHDTRYEKDIDSQESPQAMMEEDEGGDKEGERGPWEREAVGKGRRKPVTG